MSVARGCRSNALSAVEAEIDGTNESSKEVARSGTLDDIPLIAISHDPQAAPDRVSRARRTNSALSGNLKVQLANSTVKEHQVYDSSIGREN
jgi:hypothetical protein